MTEQCGDWQNPMEELMGIPPGQLGGFRCSLELGHSGDHLAILDDETLGRWP